MSKYLIGLYNPLIEDESKLSHCNKVYDNLNDLKSHVRVNDTIELSSEFSIYNYTTKELLDLIENYNLDIVINSKENSKQFNKFTITFIMAINEFIKNNSKTISKLLKEK